MNREVFVLLAHGSRKTEWTQPIRDLAEKVRQLTGREDLVLCFLQHAQPDLSAALDQVAADGAETIRVLPLLLASAGHVQKDVAPLLEQFARRRKIEVQLLPALGELPELAEMLADVLDRLG
jgi:sirohydrochlorin cobaltochelatase